MAQINVKDAAGLTQTAARVTNTGLTTPAESLPVVGCNSLSVAGPAALSAINTDLLTGTVSGWYDAAGWESMSVQIVGSAGISAGAVTFEQTNDLTAAAVVMVAQEITSITANPQAAAFSIVASTTRMFGCAIKARYVRVRISTAFVGGTVQAFATLAQYSFSNPTVNVQQTVGSSLVTTATGAASEDAATTASPVIIGGFVRSAVAPTTFAAGDAVRTTMTPGAAMVVKPFSTDGADWQFTTSLTTTVTAAAARAAAGASIRNFCTAVQAQNTSATATTLLLLDGATVVFQCNLPATMAAPIQITFPTPLRGTANTAFNYNFGTAGATVLLNVQGYASP